MKAAIGVDIGGTFTDIIAAREDGTWAIAKILSTAADYGQGMLAGITTALTKPPPPRPISPASPTAPPSPPTPCSRNPAPNPPSSPRPASATSSKSAACACRASTTSTGVKPIPLVPRELRFKIRERRAADGSVIEPLDPASLRDTIAAIRATGVRAVAISLINAFADPPTSTPSPAPSPNRPPKSMSASAPKSPP